MTTNLSGLWTMVERVPGVHRRVNGILIDRAILKIPTRPNPLSTHGGVHVLGLAHRPDLRQSAPSAGRGATAEQAGAEAVAGLFNRQGEMTPCEKSTVLFPYFAEWFVDGFLRSERPHADPDTGEPVRAIRHATSPTTRST